MARVTEIIAAHKGKISTECVVRCARCEESQALAVDDPDKALTVALVLLWGYDPLIGEWVCPTCLDA